MRRLRDFKPDRCCRRISRIAHRAFFLTDEERMRFVDRLWRVAAFSGVGIIACRIMSNHCSSMLICDILSSVGNGVVANCTVSKWSVIMEFYGRENEIGELRKVRATSRKFARFTVVTGRRRIGKTQLIRQALDDGESPYVHLVITKKMEKVQTAAHQRVVERQLGITFHGVCTRFAELFEELTKESLKRPFTLVLDEFQEFDKVGDAISRCAILTPSPAMRWNAISIGSS